MSESPHHPPADGSSEPPAAATPGANDPGSTLSEDWIPTRSLSPPDADGPSPAFHAARPPTSLRLGRFTVLETLGRGGMGAVLAAYDPDLDRRVAIKVLHVDRARSEIDRQRLWREAQALARLSHRNVVTVHEVGRSDGTVFVVMEFIRGQSLAKWQRSKPDWPAVLAAYRDAGQGLAAAHAADLVHRDFKPHNVMRTPDGAVKVLDFGLARPVTESTEEEAQSADDPSASWSLTRTGTVMGTPAYMAPEQHEGGDVDARSDQYAFCVSLWEALTGGTRPFSSMRLKDLVAVKRAAPPTWPDDAPAVPRVIVDALTRGLRAEPDERWPSMNALLDELRLDPGRRRRRWAMALAATAVVGLASAGAHALGQERAERCTGARAKLDGIWDDARRAEARAAVLGTERAHAPGVWTRTERALDDYADAWVEMHEETCAATTIRAEQSARLLDLRMECLQRAAVDLGATAQTLMSADDTVVEEAHELVAGLRPLSRCEDIQALEADVEPPSPNEAEAVARARERLAQARSERMAGRYEAARAAVEAADEELAEVGYGPVQTERALEEGMVLERLGQHDEAETALTEALTLALRWTQRDEATIAATALMHLVGREQQRMDGGLRYWPLVNGLSAGHPEHGAEARLVRGLVLEAKGELADAETELRAALSSWTTLKGEGHYRTTAARGALGDVLVRQGRYDEGEAELRATLAAQQQTLGPEHPTTAASQMALGALFYDQGRYEEAEVTIRSVIASWTESLGPDHPNVAGVRTNLGNVLSALDKHEEAEAELRLALASWTESLGPDHPNLAFVRNGLGAALEAQGKIAEAEIEYRAGLGAWVKALGPDHPNVAISRRNLASVLDVQEKFTEAEAEYRASITVMENTLGGDHLQVALARCRLALLLLRDERPSEALPLAEAAWRRFQGDDAPIPQRAQCEFGLGLVLWSIEGAQRDRARARTLVEDAATSYREAPGEHEGDIAQAVEWLETHPLD